MPALHIWARQRAGLAEPQARGTPRLLQTIDCRRSVKAAVLAAGPAPSCRRAPSTSHQVY